MDFVVAKTTLGLNRRNHRQNTLETVTLMVMVYLSERMQIEEEVCGATSRRVTCMELQLLSPG